MSFAVDWASQDGLVEVLEWWKDSGLEVRYSWRALHEACRGEKWEVVEWWIGSGLECKWTEWAREVVREKTGLLGEQGIPDMRMQVAMSCVI